MKIYLNITDHREESRGGFMKVAGCMVDYAIVPRAGDRVNIPGDGAMACVDSVLIHAEGKGAGCVADLDCSVIV